MAPSVALVAPDVTPDALEPIDPSEVPLPPEAARDAQVPSHPAPAPTDGVNPMDVLLGRTSPKSGPPVNPAAGVAAAESMFQMASSALTPGEGMPSHQAGDAKKIIESYRRLRSTMTTATSVHPLHVTILRPPFTGDFLL
jgi:hypothetical protein